MNLRKKYVFFVALAASMSAGSALAGTLTCQAGQEAVCEEWCARVGGGLSSRPDGTVTCTFETKSQDASPKAKEFASKDWVIAPKEQAQSNEETKMGLLKIQDEWAAARVNRDVPYLERLYAKDFRIQSMNGSVVERDADIASFATGTMKPDSVKDEDMKVSVYGETAIVTGIENVAGTYKGNYGKFSLRFTNVFVRREGRWQLVAHQSTSIANP